MYTAIRLLLVHPFISLFFFLSNFQTLKFFVTLFSVTVRPRRLKLCTHMDSVQMYSENRNQAAAAYVSLYSFFFLSNFQTLRIFITLLSGTVRPRKLKLGTHMDSGQMYPLYWNQAAPAYSSHFSFFFLSNFQTLKFSSHSQELCGLEDWNLVHVDSGQMYHVYRNQAAAAAYSSLYFFIFLSHENISSHFYQEL